MVRREVPEQSDDWLAFVKLRRDVKALAIADPETTQPEDSQERLLNLRLAQGGVSGALSAAGFWPPAERYSLSFIDIHPTRLSALLPDSWMELVRLASVADAIGSLQRPDGSYLSETAARGLLEESAGILQAVSSEIGDRAVAEVLQLRAKELLSGQYGTAAVHQAELVDAELFVICGPVTSWRTKSKKFLHAAVAALEQKHLTQDLARLDDQVDDLLRFLTDSLEIPNLDFAPIPGFVIAELVASGGEANKFPKHFSYFLPEDEGIKGHPVKNTVVFSNVYLERFRAISLELFQLYSGDLEWSAMEALLDPMWLLSWFKGHDTGHSVRTETTDFKLLRPFGFDASIVLQEAVADVIGYLAVSGPWNPAGATDAYLSSVAVLSELLRYLRRGAGFFPDSGAAFLELSYLAEQGFITLEPERGVIEWSPEKLIEGMSMLARDLIRAVIVPDVGLVERLLEKYSHWSNQEFAAKISKLFSRASGLPNDVGYRVAVD